MTKNELEEKVFSCRLKNKNNETAIKEIYERFEKRIYRKKGSEVARDRFHHRLIQLCEPPYCPTTDRRKNWEATQARTLAAKAGLDYDEHGSYRGDYLTVNGISYVPPWESTQSPYWDMGGEGLGLIECTRKRVYARSCGHSPSYVSTRFLVGRNEVGTYFSHPVSPNCDTVEEAVQWIWGGRGHQIIQRQGDIALIRGGGPRLPAHLPRGHKIEGDIIVHDTHPDLRIPSMGERIIVGKRAAERASEATRD